ncbi:MAG: sugar ABC transporter substrate-binding protein [Armatimonadetes bacterium]|nr:sugar ABC transporter substrate-binding protein [Armatimonadota bacterium]
MKLKLISRQQETFENAFRAQIADFQRVHPHVEVECTFLPIHDHYEKMVANMGTESDEFDLFLCCTDWLPILMENESITALDEMIDSNPPVDWPNGWHPAMLGLQQRHGYIYGLPWHDGPQVFHYRTDLFNDPNEQNAFREQHGRDLRVPETWDEFLEVAMFFTRPDKGLWGCCEAAYTDGHNNVYDFLIHLWSRGGRLLDADRNPVFDSPIGVEALQFYVDLFHKHKVASPECLNLGSVECGDYYAQGNAAMMWNWCGFAAVAEMPEYSKIVGKNACTKLPAGSAGSVSLNIYWVLTIPSGSENKELAYQFLQHISGPATDKMVSMAGANGVRLSTWNDPEVRAKYPYYGIIADVHANTRTLPAIPEYPEINEAISRAVHRALHGEMSVEESLKKAASEARTILKK